jgi:hypothetical protein
LNLINTYNLDYSKYYNEIYNYDTLSKQNVNSNLKIGSLLCFGSNYFLKISKKSSISIGISANYKFVNDFENSSGTPFLSNDKIFFTTNLSYNYILKS